MVVVAMTSNPTQTPYSFIITNEDLLEGQLNRPSSVRVDKIYTLAQTLTVRIFGTVKPSIIKHIKTLLNSVTKM